MIVILAILYAIIGACFSVWWLSSHLNSREHVKLITDWRFNIFNDPLLLGMLGAHLVWPVILLIFGCSKLLKLIRPIKIASQPPSQPVLITNADAVAVLLHKTLRHLVKACEIHTTTCTSKEASMTLLINFSKEVLESDLNPIAIRFIGNLEKTVLSNKSDLNKITELLALTIQEINEHGYNKIDPYLIDEATSILNNYCLCFSNLATCTRHK